MRFAGDTVMIIGGASFIGSHLVGDNVSTLLLANEKITDGKPVNTRIRDYILFNEVVEAISEYLDWETVEINHMTIKPVGVRNRAADTSRAKEPLGGEPEYTLE